MNTHTLLGVVLHCITLIFNSTTSDAVSNFQEKINNLFKKTYQTYTVNKKPYFITICTISL